MLTPSTHAHDTSTVLLGQLTVELGRFGDVMGPCTTVSSAAIRPTIHHEEIYVLKLFIDINNDNNSQKYFGNGMEWQQLVPGDLGKCQRWGSAKASIKSKRAIIIREINIMNIKR